METTNRLTAISLFSGAGGMDIGVQQAGFDILACCELDKHCCETLRENIKRESRNTTVYEGDIKDFTPKQMLDDLHIHAGYVDLLFGGASLSGILSNWQATIHARRARRAVISDDKIC